MHKKLVEVKKKLLVWKKESRYLINTKIEETLLEILDLHIQQESVLYIERVVDRNALLKSLNDLKRVEEIYWRQCSRSKWLKEGNRDTKYFHIIASAHKRQNDISGITILGIDLDDHNAMECAVVNYIEWACTTEVEFTPKLNNVLFKYLSDAHVAQLESDISLEELKRAVFALPSNKAPGPNGFPLIFFHKF
ncbi:uncharacterized protein LOC105421405 [Amborella trichopoda]|uniref:uncharacterized protein LOC105421405 n=1 Tax=Amborella trichopoda TaxID=13333 RepID=UPI0005D39D44|nr:uncharacterized protein LOC105421405 [Amborella trichopoda]|eukprot:XP_011627013.1 uncharacterized protein LOC105421405 [Amborella trichopoda]